MGGRSRKKTDLSRLTRQARKRKEYRALRRKQMWMDSVADSLASLGTSDERIATSFEMEANWQAFSIAVARSKMLNPLDVYRNQNKTVSVPQPVETFVKQEVQENSSDSVNSVTVKLEFETQEDMDKRLTEDPHFVNVESINTFKVEQEE